jgi:VIT1/CCC1 family predicted Fe2+/Mn2+ transporter
MRKGHDEPHRINKIGRLRAAVPGVNDRIISTAGLVSGVASMHVERSPRADPLGWTGSVCDVNGDWRVSVSSQADTGKAALRSGRRQ